MNIVSNKIYICNKCCWWSRKYLESNFAGLQKMYESSLQLQSQRPN